MDKRPCAKRGGGGEVFLFSTARYYLNVAYYFKNQRLSSLDRVECNDGRRESESQESCMVSRGSSRAMWQVVRAYPYPYPYPCPSHSALSSLSHMENHVIGKRTSRSLTDTTRLESPRIKQLGKDTSAGATEAPLGKGARGEVSARARCAVWAKSFHCTE